MRPMRADKLWGSLLLVLVVGVTAARLIWHREAPEPVGKNGVQRLFDQEMIDPAGNVQALAQWRGQRVLVNFWASWCGPCRDEMPLLDAAAQSFSGNGVQVLGIAWDTSDKVKAYLAENPVKYPVLVANGGIQELMIALGDVSQGLPFSVLVDADGRVRAKKTGPLRAEELRDWLSDHSVANGVEKR